MTRATVGVTPFTLAVALCIATVPLSPCSAQVLRGIARAHDGGRPIESAQVMALNSNGKNVGSTVTDLEGRFYLKVQSKGAPFAVSVRRIGVQPTTSELMTLSSRDTLDVEFLVMEMGIRTDTVRVTAQPQLNEIRLSEAKRRGWRIFPPAQIEERRERVNSFGDLIRTLGYPGLIVPNRPQECIRSTRYNRCLAIAIDGVVISDGNPLINPRDVYFLAVLSASEAAMQFGDRAPYGAIAVYTRMRGDKP